MARPLGVFASAVHVGGFSPISVPFTGTNGDPWPSPWTVSGSTGFGSSIQSNRGRLTYGSAGSYNDVTHALYGDIGISDFTVTCDMQEGNTNEQYPSIAFRTDGAWTGLYPTNGFVAEVHLDSNLAQLYRIDGGSRTNITSQTVVGSYGASAVHVKVQCIGTALKMRVWIGAASEPGTWLFEVTDSNHTTRTNVGLTVIGGNPSVANGAVDYDNFAVVVAP